ncbi:MAG: HAMP domain-containing protein [Actinomycetia bacterium]|nr:HAMP domain-containing protein [Actinomycetes bacterium]
MPAIRSVRVRVTVGATTIVFVALIGASLLLVSALRSQLMDQLDTTLTARVSDRVSLIDAGTDPASLANAELHDSIAWIGTPDGITLSFSGHLFAELPTLESGSVATVEVSFIESGGSAGHLEVEQVRLAAGQSSDGAVLVYMGQEVESVESTISSARRSLLIGVPVLILLVGAAVWVAVGRALDPVERIRTQAEAVSGTDLDVRVPVVGSGDEIDRLAHTVNDMLDRLSEHNAVQRRFASDASHELKSPTANIKVLAETASADDWDQTRLQIASEADRLGGLVDDLLFLNTAGERALAAAPVDLDDIVFDEAELLAARSDVEVHVGRVTPVRVDGSLNELRRLVRNLADNAARHANSTVEFDLQETDTEVVLVITDDGDGVPLEDRERVFQRFARLDDSRQRSSGGTGLGLSIVADIAARHGGEVVIADPGNRFVFRLAKRHEAGQG